MTTLTYRLAGTLAAGWGPGDEVVVTRLDHDANVRPWVQAAARAGATVRWADVRLPEGDLPAAAVRRADLGTDQAGRGDRGQQRDRHPPGRRRPSPPWPAPPGRSATWTGCTPRRTARSTCARSAPTSTRPAPTSGRGRTWARSIADPGLLETLAPDKLAPAPGRGARAVRAGHAAVRRPGRRDRGGRAPGRAGRPAAAGIGRRVGGGGRGSGSWPAWPRRRRTSRSCSRVLLGGLDAMTHVTHVRQGRAPHRTAYFTSRAARRGRSPSTWPTARSTCGTATTTPGS